MALRALDGRHMPGVEHPLRSAVPLFPFPAEPAATVVPCSNKFHRLNIVTLLGNFHFGRLSAEPLSSKSGGCYGFGCGFERPCVSPRQPEKSPRRCELATTNIQF
jgi:hypothetical protein